MPGNASTPLLERLWNKVDTTGECWLYQGGTVVRGGYRSMYSHFDGPKRMQRLVHRIVWEAEHGPVPHGFELLHNCHTPNCVRPDHIRLGTRHENEWDKDPFRLPFDRRRTCTSKA